MVDYVVDKINNNPHTMKPITPPLKMSKMISDNFGANFDLSRREILIIGLCGGQGGGKTKLSKILSKNVMGSAIIEERSYFKVMPAKRKLSTQAEPLFNEIAGYSKDRKLLLVDLSDPSCYDYEKFYRDLKSLKEGNPITIKKFNEDSGTYSDKETTIKPNDISMVIIEGYFIFLDKKVKDLIDLKIFVEIDDDIRLSRLLQNENKFLNNNVYAINNFFMIYKNYIKTSYDKYIEPTKHEARIHLPNYTVRDDEVIDGDQTFEVLKNMLTFIAGQRTIAHPKKPQSPNH